MLGLIRVSLVRRFVGTVRTQGMRPALSRTRDYVQRQRKGLVGGSVPVTSGASGAHYLAPVWASLAQRRSFHIACPPALHRRRRKLAIIGDLNLPQCRKYRVEQLAEFWQAQEVDVDFAHWQDVPRATAILQDATHLVCYRLRSQPVVSMYLYEARRLRLPILYDIDDPLFSVSAYETYGNMDVLDPGMRAQFAADAPAYLDVLNACDIVSVSTPGMAAHTAQLTARPVHLRRNFADRSTLDAGEQAMRLSLDNQGMFRVAFASGSRGHEADFAVIAAPLATFLAADPRRRLMILGYFDRSRLPGAAARQAECHDFSDYESYLRLLAQADCAVMPLTDDIFNRCKSAVRAIDAAAVGVPAICSDVGDFPNLIDPDRTGLIARSPQDWARALVRLSADPNGARAMGLRARRMLESRWSGQPQPQIIDPALRDWVLA